MEETLHADTQPCDGPSLNMMLRKISWPRLSAVGVLTKMQLWMKCAKVQLIAICRLPAWVSFESLIFEEAQLTCWRGF